MVRNRRVKELSVIGLVAGFLAGACSKEDIGSVDRVAVTRAAVPNSTAALQLKVLNNSCGANQAQDFFKVVNTGATAVPLSSISIKLWVDNTTLPNVVPQIFYGGCVLDANGSCVHQVRGVTATATKFSPACGPDPTHRANWEITITNNDPAVLGAGLVWTNLQAALHLADYSNFVPGIVDWYSSCVPNTSYVDMATFALYVGGGLVTASTGVPPSCRAPQGTQQLHGQIPPGVGPGTLVGSLPGQTQLTVSVGLPLTHRTDLDAFIQQLSDPKSAQYRKYLTPDQFGAAYGATLSDYNAVLSFITSNGLTVAKTYPNRSVVLVTGTAAAIERAFFVTLNLYRRPDGTTFFAPANEPSLNLGVPVLYISDLSNFLLKKQSVGGGGTGPAGCLSSTPAAGSYVGDDFRDVYFPGCTTLDGNGQTIGLFELDEFYDAEVNQYESNPGFFATTPSPSIVRVAVPTLPPLPALGAGIACPLTGLLAAPTIVPATCFESALIAQTPVDQKEQDVFGGEGEVALDIEMLVAMAPRAAIRVYEGTQPVPILNAMANEAVAQRPSVISSSWTWNSGTPDANVANAFLQYAVQGQSFFISAGDSGAYIQGGGLPFPWDPIIDSSLMTVVGGTQLATNTGTGAYASESVWNDSAGVSGSCLLTSCRQNGICGCNLVGSGGLCNGYTVCFDTSLNRYTYQPIGTVSGGTLVCASASYPSLPIPSYQLNMPAYLSGAASAAGELSTTIRMIPDVSMVANNLIVFTAFPVQGPVSAGPISIPAADYQVFTPVGGCSGGTSAATPLWAAVAAMANQQQAAIPQPPIGFANPVLYGLASASASSYGNFHDVSTGNNFYSGSPAPTRYQARAGYDLATGLGTPNGTSCSPLNVLPPQSCQTGDSLSALITGHDVTAFMPNGSWDEPSTGVSVVAVEGGGPTLQIATPGVVNTCGGNSVTGEVVCTANDQDVYLINGTGPSPAIFNTLASGATGTESFSGGSCQTCNVVIDPLHDKAFLSIGTSSGVAAFRPLDLATSTLGTPIPANTQAATSEDVLVDGLRGFVLSPNEGLIASSATNGNYQLLNTSTGQVFDFVDPPGVPGGTISTGPPDNCGAALFDSAAEDCTTGIALSTIEFSDQLFLVDLTRASFNTTALTWSAPNQYVTIPEFQPLVCNGVGAGTDGIAIAPGSHLGVVTGEFSGSSALLGIQLPSTSGGSGSTPPALADYVFAILPNTPDGRAWQSGHDPHTLTAYTSPSGNGRSYAIIEDDSFQDGTRTYLAIVDLNALLDATVSIRGGASPHTVATLSTCGGPGPNPTGTVPPAVAQCTVRYVPIGPVSVGPSGGVALPTLPP